MKVEINYTAKSIDMNMKFSYHIQVYHNESIINVDFNEIELNNSTELVRHCVSKVKDYFNVSDSAIKCVNSYCIILNHQS